MTNKTHKMSKAEIDAQMKQKAIQKSKVFTSCIMTSALTIDTIHNDSLDVTTVANELSQSVSNITDGNIQEIETMLMTQAQTLNAFFHCTLRQIAHINMINQIQTFTDVALRAQNQCRKTLAVLADLKNPRRATFIKQQNNAITQQVNNTSKSENFKNPEKIANELLSEVTHEKMDIGGTGKTIPNYMPAPTLAMLHRTTNNKR